MGEVVLEKDRVVLKVKGSKQVFVLEEDSKERAAYARLRAIAEGGGAKNLSVTGRVDGWKGHFPPFLKTLPKKPRAIQVKDFEPVK